MSPTADVETEPQTLAGLATPALVIDGAVVRRNLARMADYSRRYGLAVRPHAKTHKSLKLARLQIEAGAIGLTVAKVGEAEVMSEATDDLLLAYPAVDPARTARLARLAARRTVRVAVDTARAVEVLGEAARSAGSVIGLLVEIDVGLGRTGVAGPAEALALAQTIDQTRGVRLDGLMCYPGQIWDPADRQSGPLGGVAAKLAATVDRWRASGLAARIVSGGSTPTAYQSHLVPAYTEIRPGTYLFNDMNTVRGGYCALDDCAARIVCTVVSDAVPGHVVVDAGSKTLAADLCHPARESGHGHVVGFPRARIVRLSEEHGQIDVRDCPDRPRVGDRLTLVPNHVCPCVNLHDAVWWMEDGRFERLPIDARGKLS